jgi:hypothetical protein
VLVYLHGESKAQASTRTVSSLLKNYVGQSFGIVVEKSGEKEPFTLKEVNADYLVFEMKKAEGVVRIILPLSAISRLTTLQPSGQKDVLYSLKISGLEEIVEFSSEQ